MNEQSAEIPRAGITLPYERFLSDSASGYLMILLAVLAAHARVGQPSRPLLSLGVMVPDLPGPVLVLLGILALFLGPPLGLVLNAAGWFALGWLQVRIVNWFYRKHGRRLGALRNAYHLDELDLAFIATAHEATTLYQEASACEEVLRLFAPSEWASLSYALGCKYLVRTLCLLSLLSVPLVGVRVHSWVPALILLPAPVVLFFLAMYLTLYVAVVTLFRTYVLGRAFIGAELLDSDLREARTAPRDVQPGRGRHLGRRLRDAITKHALQPVSSQRI